MKPDACELVVALLRRTDLSEVGREALRHAYPSAPAAMLDTACFHLFTDGVGAAVEWLGTVEQFLQAPGRGIDDGATWHLVYHLYNWHQFQALLPSAREGMLELVGDAKQFLAEGDPESARHTLVRLEKILQGGLQPPRIE